MTHDNVEPSSLGCHVPFYRLEVYRRGPKPGIMLLASINFHQNGDLQDAVRTAEADGVDAVFYVFLYEAVMGTFMLHHSRMAPLKERVRIGTIIPGAKILQHAHYSSPGAFLASL